MYASVAALASAARQHTSSQQLLRRVAHLQGRSALRPPPRRLPASLLKSPRPVVVVSSSAPPLPTSCLLHTHPNDGSNRDGGTFWRRSALAANPRQQIQQQLSLPVRRRASCRCYHSTPRSEIVPLIGAAAVLAVAGRYSYRALRRMDEEWEDYQRDLQRYERYLARTGSSKGAVVAVDVGTMFAKIAINQSVVVSREGDRSVFNGLIYDDGDSNDDASPVLRSRSALERFFYENGGESCPVRLPWVEMGGPCLAGTVPLEGLEGRRQHVRVVSDSISPALAETLDRVNETLVRMVATVPAAPSGGEDMTFYNEFAQALEKVGDRGTSHGVVILPDPVAAVWGAQAKGMLPDDDDDDSSLNKGQGASKTTTTLASATLVVDVGALVSQVAVVHRDVVVSSATIPWGGEHFVQAAVGRLMDEARGPPLHDARSLSALHVQARAAVIELSTQSRVSVHVPYLFPDPGNHHLDAALSRSVLEQAVNDDIRKGLLFDTTSGGNLFSPHFPPPTDLSSLWMSCITQVLERGKMLPSNLDRVLLVGGGAKPPAVAQSLRSALFGIMGGDVTSKLVIPDVALQGELTVIGASTMLPSFEYNLEHGLQRIAS